MITIKNQGYISLHVTEINDLHFMSFHVACHFILHCTSFYVTFHIILCLISHILLYALHASYTYHACHAFCISCTSRISCIAPHITRHFMYHFMSFYHENLFHTHSCHLGLKKKGQNVILFNRAPPEWGVLIKKIKMPPD